MKKGIIYYTDNEIQDPIDSLVKSFILEANLPITSVSLKPIDFGDNYSLPFERGYKTMISQILVALGMSTADYVFFCEHDVLYHPSHFEFNPPRDNMFYYNNNNWRWLYGSDKAISYDRMISLSGLCVNREFALEHYQLRDRKIKEAGNEKFATKEPDLARKWGYEPGTKKKKRGGITDDDFDVWTSAKPNIDIRHKKTFSPPKITLESFKHPPVNWKEIPIEEIPGWDLKRLFNL